jgi:hypothetical protein
VPGHVGRRAKSQSTTQHDERAVLARLFSYRAGPGFVLLQTCRARVFFNGHGPDFQDCLWLEMKSKAHARVPQLAGCGTDYDDSKCNNAGSRSSSQVLLGLEGVVFG